MLALLSVFMLSTAPVIVKFINLSAIEILTWRMGIVSLVLFPFALKDLPSIHLKHLKNILFASLLLFFHFYFWFSGVQKLEVGTAVVIYSTNPIFTALLGHLVIGERFNIKNIVSMGLSLFGIYFAFSTESGASNLNGGIQIIFAAIFYSGYLVFSKKNRVGLNNGIYTFFLNLFTGIMAFTFFSIQFLYFSEQGQANFIPDDLSTWKYLILLSILPSILGHTLMVYIIPRYNLNFLSCLKMLSPIAATTMAYFFFNEDVGWKLLIGFILVLSGVLVSMPWQSIKK